MTRTETKYLRQHLKMDCGIAALGTLLGRSYRMTFAAVILSSEKKPWCIGHSVGVHAGELIQAARFLAYDFQKTRLTRCRNLAKVPNNSLVFQPPEEGRCGHWIVKIDNRFWCPARGFLSTPRVSSYLCLKT